jgi:hypothetical protein
MSNPIPNTLQDRVASDFQTIKTEGGQRATKIKEILRPAVSETVAEVKAGSTTLWSIAKSLTLTVVTVFRDTILPEQSAKLNNRLNERFATVDGHLNGKYGDRYQTVKQRLMQLKTQLGDRINRANG